MRMIALALSAIALMAACTSDPSGKVARPSGPGQTPAQSPNRTTPAEAKIYASVIRRLVTRDHTFGRTESPFGHIYVVNGTLRRAADPLGSILEPAAAPFESVIVDGIKKRLHDLPPIQFIHNPKAVLRRKSGAGVKNDGVIISLGPIKRNSGRVLVPNGMWCGGLCGQWLTYVLRKSEGRWKITGTTGPYVIS